MTRAKAYQKLTWEIVDNFVGRKKPLYLGLICDTRNSLVYPIPVDVEHVDWAIVILGSGYDRGDVRSDPFLLTHLVPVTIEFNAAYDGIKGMLTGVSGMEIGFGVRHTSRQFDIAHALAASFIKNGEIPLDEGFSDKIVKKWLQSSEA